MPPRTGLWLVRFAAILAIVAALLAPASTTAASGVTFGTPSARSTYPTGIDFGQPITTAGRIERAEILITYPSTIGPFVEEVPVGSGGQPSTLDYTLDTKAGGVLPNTELRARWRITSAGGTQVTGPEVIVRYEDTRFDWRVKSGRIVRVHWYQGNDAFGTKALSIGESAIDASSALLGVTETEPVDFFVYADKAAFYDALGPGTRENVGGQENGDIRTLFALIAPSQIGDAWVGTVIPHELTHLVFDTAVRNPYHFPPRWLNEGLAVYRSEGYGVSDRRRVTTAAADGSLIPLDGLTGQFPTASEPFFLAYAESVAAVDYMIRTYGQDALVSLVRSYATGTTDDEAFRRALGLDVTAFDVAWRHDVKARDPVVQGPRPDPPGPAPSDWAAVAATSGPGTSAGPSTVPTARPSAGATPPAGAANDSDGRSDSGAVAVALGLIAVGLAVIGIVLIARLPKRGPGAAE